MPLDSQLILSHSQDSHKMPVHYNQFPINLVRPCDHLRSSGLKGRVRSPNYNSWFIPTNIQATNDINGNLLSFKKSFIMSIWFRLNVNLALAPSCDIARYDTVGNLVSGLSKSEIDRNRAYFEANSKPNLIKGHLRSSEVMKGQVMVKSSPNRTYQNITWWTFFISSLIFIISELFKRRTEKKGLMKMMKIPTLKL